MAAGPAAHVTPIQSRGPGARARHAVPCRYRRTAVCHGRQRPRPRRAGQHLAAYPGPGQRPGTGHRAGVRAVRLVRGHGQRPGRSADHHPRSPGLVSWSSSPMPATACWWPPLPRPGGVSWAWHLGRVPASEPWRGWPGWTLGCARSPRSGPAARPCSWRPATPRPGTRPWPSPGVANPGRLTPFGAAAVGNDHRPWDAERGILCVWTVVTGPLFAVGFGYCAHPGGPWPLTGAGDWVVNCAGARRSPGLGYRCGLRLPSGAGGAVRLRRGRMAVIHTVAGRPR